MRRTSPSLWTRYRTVRQVSAMSKRKVFVVVVLVVLLGLLAAIQFGDSATSSAGGSFPPERRFKGRIAVSLIERRTGPERRFVFLIDLDRGQLSVIPGSGPTGRRSPGGRFDHCDLRGTQQALAPSGELSAQCLIVWGDEKGQRYAVRVVRTTADSPKQWSPKQGWAVTGVIWSPDSKAIAVLLEKERVDFSPIGLLAMGSGHPIPLHTFKVTLLSSELDHELEVPVIRKDSPSGWARIDWIE